MAVTTLPLGALLAASPALATTAPIETIGAEIGADIGASVGPAGRVDPGTCPSGGCNVTLGPGTGALAPGRAPTGTEGGAWVVLVLRGASPEDVRWWAILSAALAPSSCATMSSSRQTSSATPRRNACERCSGSEVVFVLEAVLMRRGFEG